jgi:hypothetical protein
VFDERAYPIAHCCLSKIQAVVAAMLLAIMAKGYRLRAVVAWPLTVRVDTRPYGVTILVTSRNKGQLLPLQYGGSAAMTARHSQPVAVYGSQAAEPNTLFHNLVKIRCNICEARQVLFILYWLSYRPDERDIVQFLTEPQVCVSLKAPNPFTVSTHPFYAMGSTDHFIPGCSSRDGKVASGL